ncbi:hypothetical protein SNOG_16320 [Parastagonospora nodorum SN15]|uniref:Uncharacterized protein n=1 Tax=Phaeosphaeria nodorum (strain SN15 / ATCC MYA-4574 / FGSC 10173) TaxID=321614 RepID=Q0TW09_PHANO|nr:hypothetical protein SNOG_16320 [Parastagonospora nodorum SN15]EAT76306.1 hypothetical protein SNOG_16320 [Parastagonospora nodorum SN15]
MDSGAAWVSANIAYAEKAREAKSGGQGEFKDNHTPLVTKSIHAKDMSPEESRPKQLVAESRQRGRRSCTHTFIMCR